MDSKPFLWYVPPSRQNSRSRRRRVLATVPTSEHIGLDRVPAGRAAQVVAIRLAPPDAQRLMEMGLVPGTPVEVVRRAPFGDPLEIRARKSRLSLRSKVAAQVLVVLSTAP